MSIEHQLALGEDEFSVALRPAWDATMRGLAATVNGRNFTSFVEPLRPLSYDGAIVVIGAPSAFAREWADKKYTGMIREHLDTHLSAGVQVRIVISKPDGEMVAVKRTSPRTASSTLAVVPSPTKQARNAFLDELAATHLSDRATFDTFVVGKSNRLAETVARAVAGTPGTLYNPLFIYGNPGLGKTHLMHAIGNAVRQAKFGARVACVSGETFTNHYVTSLRDKRTEEFRRAYRNVDVLLVDDIQMIASAERTKEEFFHTFNTLHQLNKQIVITSDRSPRELRTMEERLRSRFEQGMVADIGAPDFETRCAILRDKAEREHMTMTADAVEYMAALISRSVRTLEGALIKVAAYASMSGAPMSADLAAEVLGSYFEEDAPTGRTVGATVDQVLAGVAARLGVDREQIVTPGNRWKDVAFARQVAMYLCREMSRDSMIGIAQRFGCRNHSAIAHAHARLGREMEADARLASTVSTLRASIERGV